MGMFGLFKEYGRCPELDEERRESAKLPKLAFIRSAVYETAFSFWDPRQLWLSVLKAVRTP